MPIGTHLELQTFLRANRAAREFAWKAHEDYLLCRLGMLNGMWSAFEMATQATEKLLKSYLLFRDHTLNGDPTLLRRAVSAAARARGRTTELGHDVEACLDLALAAGLTLPAATQAHVPTINEWYERRYPDTPTNITSLSTAQIRDVDDVIFSVWDNFRSLNEDYYFISGILTPVYGHLQRPIPEDRTFPTLVTNNTAYDERRPVIEAEIHARIAAWRPAAPARSG